MKKIMTLEEITHQAEAYRSQGKTIAFSNGCFDILHAGHVTYLQAVKAQGDVLVLGLNSDRSVREIKGEQRPVVSQEDRACVAAALAAVDHVVIFDEPDPEKLIQAVKPDILAKGADWAEDEIIGGDFVKARGGRVARIKLEPGISTTTIIKRIGRKVFGIKEG
ncbi:MAG: D-glycero-beta-D-manno-heptose 1-phosphate adenylyltransferase [Desulfobacterales bacterium]|nr:D-glycero-beta-D-manno-heptose 1-phosphate adenylyltransferase [Desulfobacterales bacterium]